MVPVSFDIEPGEPGTFVFQLRVKAPPDDGNPRDNEREAEMEVVDRKTRVLLFASGPMRDYHFLRNQLHRDNTMNVRRAAANRPARHFAGRRTRSSTTFPARREELYQYDCIVAFDPDWTKLDAAQVELLEKWVADEAGGLIAVAGPIHTPSWIRSTEHAKLRDLYPVVFQQRLTLWTMANSAAKRLGRWSSNGPAARPSSCGSPTPPKKAKPPGTASPACSATTP